MRYPDGVYERYLHQERDEMAEKTRQDLDERLIKQLVRGMFTERIDRE
jgi:hypothetical protein